MSTTITLNTNKFTAGQNDDTVEVTLNNICLEELIPQFTANELLRAIADHYDFSTIFDWATDSLRDEE
jgi:hypothetical protein